LMAEKLLDGAKVGAIREPDAWRTRDAADRDQIPIDIGHAHVFLDRADGALRQPPP